MFGLTIMPRKRKSRRKPGAVHEEGAAEEDDLEPTPYESTSFKEYSLSLGGGGDVGGTAADIVDELRLGCGVVLIHLDELRQDDSLSHASELASNIGIVRSTEVENSADSSRQLHTETVCDAVGYFCGSGSSILTMCAAADVHHLLQDAHPGVYTRLLGGALFEDECGRFALNLPLHSSGPKHESDLLCLRSSAASLGKQVHMQPGDLLLLESTMALVGPVVRSESLAATQSGGWIFVQYQPQEAPFTGTWAVACRTEENNALDVGTLSQAVAAVVESEARVVDESLLGVDTESWSARNARSDQVFFLNCTCLSHSAAD